MGRMKEIAMLLEEGNSVYEVARIMKVDVEVIESLVNRIDRYWPKEEEE
jgi:DNA-binding CsgD family transcriptional regulator